VEVTQTTTDIRREGGRSRDVKSHPGKVGYSEFGEYKREDQLRMGSQLPRGGVYNAIRFMPEGGHDTIQARGGRYGDRLPLCNEPSGSRRKASMRKNAYGKNTHTQKLKSGDRDFLHLKQLSAELTRLISFQPLALCFQF